MKKKYFTFITVREDVFCDPSFTNTRLPGTQAFYTRTKVHPTLIPQEFIHRLRLKHIEMRVWQTE